MLCFVLAAAFCLLITPVFRRLGIKMGVYSQPGGRNVNNAPVSRLGGASVILSFVLALGVIFYVRDLYGLNLALIAGHSLLLPLICGAACIWLLGLVDDIRHLRARYKLLVQIVVAVWSYSLGLRIHAIYFPVLGVLNLGDYSPLFTVIWIIGTINAVNLIDGIDGLCSGVAISSFLGILFMALFSGVDLVAVISLALIGCTLAFLKFNFQPASIFLGDSGAYFLGFMIAALPVFIASQNSSPGVFHAAYFMFVIIPFIDTCLAILRRLVVMGISMSTPDRGHLHHRLLDRGYTHKKITAIMSFISFIIAIAGVVLAIGNRWQAAAAVLIAATAVYLLLRLCGITSVKNITPKNVVNAPKAVLLKEYAPSFFQDFIGAADWNQARKILDDFGRNTEMGRASIIWQKNGSHSVVWDWGDELSSPCRRNPKLCKTCKVFHDDACYQFYFCWDSEYSRMQNDTDALLEVISKTVGKSCHEKFFPSGVVFEKSESLLSRDGLRLAENQ